MIEVDIEVGEDNNFEHKSIRSVVGKWGKGKLAVVVVIAEAEKGEWNETMTKGKRSDQTVDMVYEVEMKGAVGRREMSREVWHRPASKANIQD